MYPVQQRPSGVSILAVLYFIGGGLYLVFALLVSAFILPFLGFDPTGTLAWLVLVCGAVFVFFAFISFLIGYGLWTLQGWARTLAIIFAILGLLNFPIGTILNIIILWYLFQPEVKYAFGQGPPPAAYYAPQYPQGQYPPQYPQQYAPAPPPTAGAPAPGACRSCGTPLAAGAKFCPKCGAPV